MNNFQITKTDYLNYRFCRKNLWLEKNRPDEFKKHPPSDFQLEIIKEGKDVDKEAQNLFPDGVEINGDQDVAVAETNYHLERQEQKVLFQAAIKADPFYIRTDVLKWNDKLDGWELYEVKATTKIKREKFNNHIYDLAFQYNVCKKAGLNVKKIGVIILNKDYRKDGEINYPALFTTEDITEEILDLAESVAEEMDLMVSYLSGPEEKYCQCRYRTRNEQNHCTTFDYSNPDVPSYAVHDVTRISPKKLGLLVEDECLDIADIPDDFKLSDNQMLQVQAAKREKPIIDIEQIVDFLQELRYPLYFLDYESYLPAIPWFDRYGPYQNIVFQYSLHILDQEMPPGADAEWLHQNIKHTEFLATDQRDPAVDISESLQRDISSKDGSVIVWHKTFEMGRNKELGQLNPNLQTFMEQINDRIIDLKEVFSKSMYVDPKTKGSASIKKVLPIMAPELSYEGLPINNGADANKSWGKMVSGEVSEKEAQKIQKDLLVYCKQDTFAMVRIWQVLKNLIDSA